MDLKLSENVYIHFLPSTKFKTVECSVHFISPLKREMMSARSLLSCVMTETTRTYPKPQLLKQGLADLFGTSLSSHVSRLGQRHLLNFHLSLADERYTKEKYFKEALQLLEEVICRPHFLAEDFPEEILQTERNHLIQELAGIYNNKRAYALREAQHFYFEDDAQKIPASGHIDEIKTLTIADLKEAYDQMINEDEIHIYILGTVDTEFWYQFFEEWNLNDRENFSDSLIYTQNPPQRVKREVITQKVQQAKLNMIFNYQGTERRPEIWSVFNGVFGGGSHSKLFKHLREKENLAYYSYSSVHLARTQMIVDMGIDEKNQSLAEEIVLEELENIIQKEISEAEMEQTKRWLINGLYQNLDNPYRIINYQLTQDLLGQQDNIEDRIKKIKSVSAEQIASLASDMILSVALILKGGTANDNN